MVFGNMGAPLEHFQANDTSDNNDSKDATVNYYNCNDDYTIMQGDTKYCMVKTDVELSEDQDMFAKFDDATTNWTDDNFECGDSISLTKDGDKYCKNVSEGSSGSNNNNSSGNNNEAEEEENNEEENNEEENNEEENNEEENNEEEGGESLPTTNSDIDQNEEENNEEENNEEEEEEDNEVGQLNFTGSMNIEHFSGQNVRERLLSLNLLLKSLLFACLFYIIAHPDTKAVVLKNIKFLKRADYLVVSMVIFFICYYILSIFV
jgi:DNA mismatch repair ATPase MutL